MIKKNSMKGKLTWGKKEKTGRHLAHTENGYESKAKLTKENEKGSTEVRAHL